MRQYVPARREARLPLKSIATKKGDAYLSNANAAVQRTNGAVKE